MPAPPNNPDDPGEGGKPVKIENPEASVKKLIDEGWQKNAFNQYVSDMISVHRSLPDPRDEWWVVHTKQCWQIETETFNA